MNTISSLFNWLGNLVGADPSTMTTTSKTIVGAINEVDGETSSLDTRVTALEGVSAIDLTGVSLATNVSIRTRNATKCGKVVVLEFIFDITASKTEGASIISNIPSEIRPMYTIDGAGTIATRLDSSGNLILSEAVPATNWNRATFTYITSN